MIIELTATQQWLLLKALTTITSDEGMAQLRKEFPDLDEDELARDAEGIINQFEEDYE